MFFTQKKASEMLGVSNITINKYIKELTEEEKKEKFNNQNQPNEKGIELLKKIRNKKNTGVEFSNSKVINDEEITKLKAQIDELKERNKQLEEENKELNKKGFEYADKFAILVNQQQQLTAQANQQLEQIKALENKEIQLAETIEIKEKELEEQKNKGFWARLFNK